MNYARIKTHKGEDYVIPVEDASIIVPVTVHRRKGKVISINSHEALVHYVKNWNGNAYTNPRGGCVSECKYCEPKKFARAKTRRALQPKLRGRSYWKPGPRDWDVVESWHKFKERKGEDNG